MVIIYFTENDLSSLITDDKLVSESITISYAGCMEHQGLRVVKELANMISETDLICDRATFEVEVAEIINKNK